MQEAISTSVATMMTTGQSRNGSSRVLVPKSSLPKAEDIARKACEGIVVGDSRAINVAMGPLASKMQFEKVQRLIGTGIDGCAKLICCGLALRDGIGKGYFTRATVFRDVNNQVIIAREEILGPLRYIILYETEEKIISIANDAPYGLLDYVFSGYHDSAGSESRGRTGAVHMNCAPLDLEALFGGYMQSGTGYALL